MKAAVLTKAGSIELKEVPMVSLHKDTEVIIKVKAVGICGTDLHIFNGERADVKYPRIMGHELSGIVVKKGEQARQFDIGDHVIFNPVIACHQCPACEKEHENVCNEVKCFGVQMDGGYQEYISVEEASLYRIPKNIPFETAALGEPFSIAANIMSKLQIKEGDNAVIIGAGTIGIAVLKALKKAGARVMATDISDKKLENAARFGADIVINTARENLTEQSEKFFEKGIDIIIDAVGISETLNNAVKIASPCASIIVLGFDNRPLNITPADITKKELKFFGSRMNNRKFPEVVRWLEEKVITEDMITKTYSFADIQKAFEDTLAHGDEWIKTMIVMEEAI